MGRKPAPDSVAHQDGNWMRDRSQPLTESRQAAFCASFLRRLLTTWDQRRRVRDTTARNYRRDLSLVGAEAGLVSSRPCLAIASSSRGPSRGRGGDFGSPAWPPCLPPMSCLPSRSFSRV